MAAGLTLVFGIMNMVNLAHGSLYMMGAYLRRDARAADRQLRAVGAAGAGRRRRDRASSSRRVALRTLYSRDHLDQVLATFGLILFFNELVRILWGPHRDLHGHPAVPRRHRRRSSRARPIRSTASPSSRVGLLVAIFLYWLITRTRIGMLIRAGASNREMVGALGVDIKLLYTLVFGLGRGARRPRRADGRAALRGRDRHGRHGADHDLRRDRDRRHRLDPRRLRRAR